MPGAPAPPHEIKGTPHALHVLGGSQGAGLASLLVASPELEVMEVMAKEEAGLVTPKGALLISQVCLSWGRANSFIL